MQRTAKSSFQRTVLGSSVSVALVFAFTACGGGGGTGETGAVPRTGTWGGEAADGDTVNFSIDSSGIKTIFAEFCNGWRSVTFTAGPPVLGADGSFSLSDAGDSITGVVRADGSATGTLRRSASCGPAERTWTAARRSDRTDVQTPIGEISSPSSSPYDVAMGATVQLVGGLDHTFSTATGAELFNWVFASKPDGSNASLTNTPSTKFLADAEGTYVAKFFVSNGVLRGPTSNVTVRVGAPTATIAGLPDFGFGPLVSGLPAFLDATRSTDQGGGPLSYSWTLVRAPAGSSAAISDPESPRTSFVPDKGGIFDDYVIRLDVSDGASTVSTTKTLRVDDRSSVAPYASAGPDQEAVVGVPITLDASGSSTIDGAALTYSWLVETRPPGSMTNIVDGELVHSSFTPDVAGDYSIKLTVRDSSGWPFGASTVIRIMAGTGNAKPVARAGTDREVSEGATVTLDASGSSDANSDVLRYRWSLLSRPAQSSAALSGAASAAPTFLADRVGPYVVQLVVSDGAKESVPDTVVINAR